MFRNFKTISVLHCVSKAERVELDSSERGSQGKQKGVRVSRENTLSREFLRCSPPRTRPDASTSEDAGPRHLSHLHV
ncbi:Hypothetical predicted protein [Cloeon dipterum]|uniref:Uncharacterized protein n=1 Tax=Cloeon dipterum TaxID=197152 RepID=A0A8S1D8Q6_9INSE|nr:Hypothetical predicted protein [Cloeon dipterum]